MLSFDLNTQEGEKQFEEWQAEQIKNGNATVSEELVDVYVKQGDGNYQIKKQMAKFIRFGKPCYTSKKITLEYDEMEVL